MRFLHLGDLHIGKKVNDFSMKNDQKYILDNVLDMIREHEVDGLLIAGDVYDRSEPSEEAVNLLNDFISTLAQEKIPTYIISGNHDSDDRLNFGRTLFENQNIIIYSKFDGTLCKRTLEKGSEKVNIYMLPYVKASQVRRFYPDEEIKTYEDAVRVVIEHTEINQEECNILIAHQFVAGKSVTVSLGGSENLAVQNVGTIEVIGYDIFDGFDYVALGHIHSPQKIGREEVRYSGSPLPYSLNEVDNRNGEIRKKSAPLIELGIVEKSGKTEKNRTYEKEGGSEYSVDDKNKKYVKIELIPFHPLRNMRKIRGPIDVLIAPENVVDSDDYIYAVLTDEEPRQNAMNIMRQYYPNIMKLEYDNSHSREITHVDLKNVTRGKSFDELISEFYQSMYGCEISEDEMALMKEVAREAGVIDEAN